jgi:hypothetical protein
MRKEKKPTMSAHLRSAVRPENSVKMAVTSHELIKKCPCCGQLIQPKMKDYLPSPGTYKQYRCEHCSAWLTIDLRSRIKLIALASMGIFLIGTGAALLLVATKAPIYGHERLAILPFALVFGIGGQYVLAWYMQKIVKWVPVDS